MKNTTLISPPENANDKDMYFTIMYLYIKSGFDLWESHLRAIERINNYKN